MNPEDKILAAQSEETDLRKQAEEDPLLEAEVKKLASMWDSVGEAASTLFPPSPGRFAGNLTSSLAQAAAAATAFEGVRRGYDAISRRIGNIGEASRKAKNFEEMMTANPHLQDEDATQVQMAFNTLHRFNPAYAQDPLVAGSFVRQVTESARVPLNVVNEVVRANSGTASGRSPFEGALGLVREPKFAPGPTQSQDQYDMKHQAEVSHLDAQTSHHEAQARAEEMRRAAEEARANMYRGPQSP